MVGNVHSEIYEPRPIAIHGLRRVCDRTLSHNGIIWTFRQRHGNSVEQSSQRSTTLSSLSSIPFAYSLPQTYQTHIIYHRSFAFAEPSIVLIALLIAPLPSPSTSSVATPSPAYHRPPLHIDILVASLHCARSLRAITVHTDGDGLLISHRLDQVLGMGMGIMDPSPARRCRKFWLSFRA